MFLIAAASLVLLGQETQSECAPNATGSMTCISRASPPRNETCAGRDWLLAGCTLGAHREAVARVQQRESSAALRLRVSGMLADDDCAGASRAALAGGDISLAREVREFCAAPKPPAP